MKLRNVFFGLTLVVTTADITTRVVAQQRPDKAEQERNIQRFLELNRPGEEHKRLHVFVGKWATKWTVWFDPNSPRCSVTRGTATFQLINGGRLLEGHFNGDRMMGRPFEAKWIFGYNKLHGHYESTWTNSFETPAFTFNGEAQVDAASGIRGFTLTGKADDHPTGRRDLTYRVVITIKDQNNITEEVFGPDINGEEFKATEIMYTRIRGVRRR